MNTIYKEASIQPRVPGIIAVERMAVSIRQAALVSNGDGRTLRRVANPPNGQRADGLGPEEPSDNEQGEEDVAGVGNQVRQLKRKSGCGILTRISLYFM